MKGLLKYIFILIIFVFEDGCKNAHRAEREDVPSP
jgi:hypothetical protein